MQLRVLIHARASCSLGHRGTTLGASGLGVSARLCYRMDPVVSAKQESGLQYSKSTYFYCT